MGACEGGLVETPFGARQSSGGGETMIVSHISWLCLSGHQQNWPHLLAVMA